MPDPGFTATWYLEFGATVEEIYDLGTKRASLEHACFNPETITIITDKLPFSDSYQLHDSTLEGQDHLKEIMNMIKKRKVNAQKRANNIYNAEIRNSPLTTTPYMATPNLTYLIHQPLQGLRSCTPDSRAGLKSVVGQRGPTPTIYYDMQNPASYTRQPKRYQVNPSGTTNNDCRIFKVLDTSGEY